MGGTYRQQHYSTPILDEGRSDMWWYWKHPHSTILRTRQPRQPSSPPSLRPLKHLEGSQQLASLGKEDRSYREIGKTTATVICSSLIIISSRNETFAAPYGDKFHKIHFSPRQRTFGYFETGHPIKVPSPCEPLREPSAVPSCEEKGSAEGSYEGSDENTFHVKVHVKVHMKVQMKVHFM